MLQSHCCTAAAEMDMIRREIASLRMENTQLRSDLAAGPGHHAPPAPVAPPTTFTDPFANSSRTELPPLRSIGGTIPSGPESMTGVQYEPARVNGYREERF